MSIATYAELKLAVANWLGRDDVPDARISDFVVLFEAVANRVLRVQNMREDGTIVMTGDLGDLPTDFLAPISLSTSGGSMEYADREWLHAAFGTQTPTSGIPRYWTFFDHNTIQVYPQDGETINLYYYQKIPALSDSATTNWLLTAYPDLYLFGSLVESEMFLVNDERALSWKSRRDELFEEVRQLSNRSRGATHIRLVQPTP